VRVAPAPVAIALDLGTTRIKAGIVDDAGKLSHVRAVDSPPAFGRGLIRHSDPEEWRDIARDLVGELEREIGAALPIGLSTQRSSFLFVDALTGRPLSALVSWQDRSAAPWCEQRREIEPLLAARTGLVLSPHYVGPKLAQRVQADRELAASLARGATLVRTLDAWIVAALESEASARTDLSCAARTALVDLAVGDYDDELCALFGVPSGALAPIEPSVEPNARRVRAHLADQAAAVLAALGEDDHGALVSLGTAGFVSVAVGARPTPVQPYLCAPFVARGPGRARYAVEGTINGGGATADRFAKPPTIWPASDPTPEEFCMPDESGWGAPYWLSDRSLRFSGSTPMRSHADLRRVVIEGLCFRAAALLADLERERPVSRVALAGGLAHDPFVPRALAAILARPIDVVASEEAGLAAVGRLAAGLDPRERGAPRTTEPADGDRWLATKFERWRAWVRTTV
jgi:glycerol kinase